MQRGEVEGRGNNTWAGYKATFQTAIKERQAQRADPDRAAQGAATCPTCRCSSIWCGAIRQRELIADFMSHAVAIARPFAAPPGVPKDRVELLRRACDATMADPKFLAEAAKLEAEIDPLNGRQVQDIVERVLATPKPTMNRIQTVLGLPAN